jgi:hypothetical protein
MIRVYGGQPVDMGNAGAFQAQSPLYTTPLSPVWGGGPLVPGDVPGREYFRGPEPTQKYKMGSSELSDYGGAFNGDGAMIAQSTNNAQGLLQKYLGALLNPFGFLKEAQGTVNKINERNRKQEEMINELLYNR